MLPVVIIWKLNTLHSYLIDASFAVACMVNRNPYGFYNTIQNNVTRRLLSGIIFFNELRGNRYNKNHTKNTDNIRVRTLREIQNVRLMVPNN